MQHPVSAIFFDFGGTLFSYRGVQGKSFYPILLESLERLGVEAEPKAAGRAYREASRESFQEFNPKAYYLHRELFEDTFSRFARNVGGQASREFLDWMYEQQRRMFLDSCTLRDDCMATLGALRDAGLHVAIVSNIDDDYLHPMVEQTGLTPLLHAWTSSEEARSCKPDSAIFHHALGKAKVDSESVIFVGDSLHHDVQGANRLGMRSVLIREPGVPALGDDGAEGVEPDHVIEQLSELLPIATGTE